jgi:hypothetical protein
MAEAIAAVMRMEIEKSRAFLVDLPEDYAKLLPKGTKPAANR